MLYSSTPEWEEIGSPHFSVDILNSVSKNHNIFAIAYFKNFLINFRINFGGGDSGGGSGSDSGGDGGDSGGGG